MKSLMVYVIQKLKVNNKELRQKILRVKISKDKSKCLIFLSQKKYLTKVLNTYKSLNSKPIQTPLAMHFKLSNSPCPKTDDEKLDKTNVPQTLLDV